MTLAFEPLERGRILSYELAVPPVAAVDGDRTESFRLKFERPLDDPYVPAGGVGVHFSS